MGLHERPVPTLVVTVPRMPSTNINNLIYKNPFHHELPMSKKLWEDKIVTFCSFFNFVKNIIE